MSTRTLFVAFIIYVVSSLGAFAVGQDSPTALPSFSQPGVSPDGKEIVFVSAGDLWTAPTSGGDARLLVAHPAEESRPLFSPDGSRVAFASTRSGNGDLYVLTLPTGALQRVTIDDAVDNPDAWSLDGKHLYYSSTSRDIGGQTDVYRIALDGGTAMPVTGDRFFGEYFGAPSPDGTKLAFTARGTGLSYWWRKGHSHLDESAIHLRNEDGSYQRLSEKRPDKGAREMWPLWSADGKTVYYVSDRTGVENFWSRELGGDAKQRTRLSDGRVLWPSMSADGKTIVFERDFGIWKWEPAGGSPAPVSLTRRGASSTAAVERQQFSSGFTDFAVAPDGKKVAFIAHGEVFAASAKDGGDAFRVTNTLAPEDEPVWSTDSRRLLYISARDGVRRVYQYDFTAAAETRLTSSEVDDDTPVLSPDGKKLAFIRGGRELRLLDLDTKAESVLVSKPLPHAPFTSRHWMAWSPDSQWIAAILTGPRGYDNVYVLPPAGGDARPVTFFAHAQSYSVSWSGDGASLLFGTGQRTEDAQLARVELSARSPKFREDQFRDLFKSDPAKPGEKTPVRIDFEDIRRRVSLLPVDIDIDDHVTSPDGKWAVVLGSRAGQQNLYTYPLEDNPREAPVLRQLTSTAGRKAGPQFTADSKEVYYLESGRIYAVPVDTRTPRAVVVSAEMDVDFNREKLEVFQQAWAYLRDWFYDDKMNGVDWQAARRRYLAYVAGAGTPDELRRLMNLMIGELNASHTGIDGPGTFPATVGRLGLRFDTAEYAASGRLKVSEVIPLGPAALSGGVKVGDYLLAVDGKRIEAKTNLDQLLEHTVGKRVDLTVASTSDGEKREVAVKPIARLTERGLLYKQWVEEKRQYVSRASGGRLGYVHIPDMGQASLRQLYVDLDAENQGREGVVIDIRNNSGGFVNAYALDVFTRRPYITMTPRGYDQQPARSNLGQRTFERPTILITNQATLSDGEDFTEGYRALKVGKVVGEATAGWIVFTSNVDLLDGSSLRLPASRIRDSKGEDMENNPRPVDLHVERPVGESYTGKDVQLDTAVKELLKDL